VFNTVHRYLSLKPPLKYFTTVDSSWMYPVEWQSVFS